MAECFWPGVSAQQVADAGERVRQASYAISADDGSSRYLGSILVPTDEIALFLFEATSLEAASEVNRRAEIPFERILEVVRRESPWQKANLLPVGERRRTNRKEYR
ncbi:MAG TPA: hypothetical protein VIL92_13715 [Gaiellaceae bacterium]|jgi:hypothetical protein